MLGTKNILVVIALLLCGVTALQASKSPLKQLPGVSKKWHKRGDEESSPAKSTILTLRGGAEIDAISSLDWRYFAAGGLCAAWSHGITTPLDVVKTRMQAFPEQYKGGVIAAALDIIHAEGLSFLLAGLGPTVVGYGLEGALKFGFYETCKKLFSDATPSTFVNFMLASVVAGAIASIVLCPMEEARIKMVKEHSWADENVVTGLVRLVKEDGLFGSFESLQAMLSKQVPYTMGKQVSFDFIAGCLYALASSFDFSKDDLKWIISIASAFLASIVACLASQPGDTILTMTYAEGTDLKAAAQMKGRKHSSFIKVVRDINSQYGLKGYYLGTKARIAHVGAIITTQLVVYDMVKMALGLPVTGSH